MTNKEESFSSIENYGCLVYTSKLECKTCNGFGRNTDKSVNVKECYLTRNQVKEYLDLNKEIF